jgi:hypothetical protein
MTVPTGQTSGSAVDRTFAITPAQVADLKAGLYYFNVHSANFGGGEIRGQILPLKITTVDMNADAKTDFTVIHEGAASLAKATGSRGLGFVRLATVYGRHWQTRTHLTVPLPSAPTGTRIQA